LGAGRLAEVDFFAAGRDGVRAAVFLAAGFLGASLRVAGLRAAGFDLAGVLRAVFAGYVSPAVLDWYSALAPDFFDWLTSAEVAR